MIRFSCIRFGLARYRLAADFDLLSSISAAISAEISRYRQQAREARSLLASSYTNEILFRNYAAASKGLHAFLKLKSYLRSHPESVETISAALAKPTLRSQLQYLSKHNIDVVTYLHGEGVYEGPDKRPKEDYIPESSSSMPTKVG